MSPGKLFERLIYALVIILSLAVLALFAAAPYLMESQSVYQGF
jgi:hypothetical protein